jgi:hypothetical protein
MENYKILKLITIFLISLLVISCELSTIEPRVITEEELLNYETKIIQLSESVNCTNSSDWEFTPMGNKPCGGPVRYIAYHKSVKLEFLNLVKRFTSLQKAYNEQNNVFSDCPSVVTPKNVKCESGKAILVY